MSFLLLSLNLKEERIQIKRKKRRKLKKFHELYNKNKLLLERKGHYKKLKKVND